MRKHEEKLAEKKRMNFESVKQALETLADNVSSSMPSLAFSLKSAVCTQEKDDTISLEVNNKIAESDLEHNKQKIVAFVKESTGIDEVVLIVKCKEYHQKKKIYTSAETYRYFKEKRPAIDSLIKAFNCEFKY